MCKLFKMTDGLDVDFRHNNPNWIGFSPAVANSIYNATTNHRIYVSSYASMRFTTSGERFRATDLWRHWQPQLAIEDGKYVSCYVSK